MKRFSLFLSLALIAVLALSACVSPDPGISPLAAPVEAVSLEGTPLFPPEAYTVQGFLSLLASGGLAYLIGMALSFLFVEVQWFQNLDAGQKRLLSIVASIALPLLAQTALMTVPAEFMARLDPLWATFVVAVAGLVGNKQTYRGTIKPQEREWIIEDGDPISIN